MNEAETRAEHIDPALMAAGWGVVEGSRILREHAITQGRLQGGGKRTRADIADYVLVYRNTQLAVVEAKAWNKPCSEGVAQAKSYAQKLALRFAFATNGQRRRSALSRCYSNNSIFFSSPTSIKLFLLEFVTYPAVAVTCAHPMVLGLA